MIQRQNGLLKILVPLVLVVVIGILVMSGSSKDVKQAEPEALRLTDEEARLLGIEADTPRDIVATLVGQVKGMRDETESLRDETLRLREQNERLTNQEHTLQRRIDEALRQERERLESERYHQTQSENSLLDSLQQRIDQLSTQIIKPNDIPIGLGLEGSGSDLVWIDPLDVEVETRSGRTESRFPTSFSEARGRFEGQLDTEYSRLTQQAEPIETVPVYTIPENSTLMGSVAMTALLGRVPINGTVNDPYPFKVIIGEDNLTANGIELPEIQSAIVSGTASGDWTLSCVRGQINSMTFVFRDGTVRTIPQPARGGNTGSGNNKQVLGWISDPSGLPCVPGERKTNAREFLLTSFILGAAQAGAGAMAANEFTTTVSDGTATSFLTGDAGKAAAAQALSGGVSDVRQWVQERFGQTFDAVYVPPGNPVAVHIEREIPIDIELDGRKVRYDTAIYTRELP